LLLLLVEVVLCLFLLNESSVDINAALLKAFSSFVMIKTISSKVSKSDTSSSRLSHLIRNLRCISTGRWERKSWMICCELTSYDSSEHILM
jgi:hypothetical protein